MLKCLNQQFAGQDLKQLEMLEGQLTWLVHIIGAVVRGRMNTTGVADVLCCFSPVGRLRPPSSLGWLSAFVPIICSAAALGISGMRLCSFGAASAGADAHETMDGDLAARVFGLLQLVDAGYHTTR